MQHWWNHLIDRGRQPGVRRVGLAALAVAIVALTLNGVNALAGPRQAPPPVHHPRGGHAQPISGTIPRALAHATRGAREDGARALTLTISLQPQHRADLDQLILDQQNPKSASYHKYLSPQAFTDKFGATPDAVAAVRAFLEKAGLHVTDVSANRLQINATSSVAQAEQAFSTTISQYQLDTRTVYAPDSEPVVPDSLVGNILAVTGLDNVAVFHPLLLRQARRAPAHPASGPQGGFDPTELRAAYDVTPLIGASGNGSGQRVAVFELAPYIPGDLTAYRTQFGLPNSTVNNHSIGGATVTCATAGTSCDVAGVAEADLDLEIVSALAPSATQDVYTGFNPSGVLDTYQAIATDNVAKVVTTSWGLCETSAGTTFLQSLATKFAQMASQGQTIYAASGDTGADDCRVNSGPATVDSPASDPNVVGVGGTTLSITNIPSYGGELTWNDSVTQHNPIGTGGGTSANFSRPSWQQGAGMPTAQLRLVPDVSASADPYSGYAIYCSSVPDCNHIGWFGGFGGTSAAAPLWAAITADINTYLAANSKPVVGWINSTLYQVSGNAQTFAPFHDVTSGNNTVNSVTGFTAGQCYDQTTGLGTPDAWNIARDIAGGVLTAGGGPCPIIPNTATNLIQNGGFEANTAAPWHEFSQGGFEPVLPFGAHTGSKAFLPCSYPSCDDRVWQTVTVPAAVSSATLTYWVDAFSWLQYSTPPLACLDHFYVTLATPDGTVFDTVQSSCASNSFGYSSQVANVTSALQAHLNQQIVVMIRGTAAGLAGNRPYSSGWDVDDVSLFVS